ncbi:MAG: hypothetical protein VKJ64_14510 [Leptolyngbyaceae bacterium]|nr:hypothetical protein [Leptolyngbyaceae bacterium]
MISGRSGAIINAANLAVGAGRSLTLIGETAVSSSILTAPGGQVAIASIPAAVQVQLGARGQIREITSLAGLRSTPRSDAFSVSERLAQTTADLGWVLTLGGRVAIAASATVIPTTSGDTVISGGINDNVRAYSYAGRGGSIDLISDRGSVAVRGSQFDSVGLSGVGEIRGEAPGGTVLLDAVSYYAALEVRAGGPKRWVFSLQRIRSSYSMVRLSIPVPWAAVMGDRLPWRRKPVF